MVLDLMAPGPRRDPSPKNIILPPPWSMGQRLLICIALSDSFLVELHAFYARQGAMDLRYQHSNRFRQVLVQPRL
jgi:hypothetical protein